MVSSAPRTVRPAHERRSRSPLPAAIALAALVTISCASEEGARTSGRRVLASFVARGSVAQDEPFTTSLGYTVRLTSARASLGALYFFEGEPAVATRERRRAAPAWWSGWPLVGVAHAHPGHYSSGQALGELTSGVTADLLGESVLGDGAGVTGTWRSARVVFQGDAGDEVAHLEGVAVVSGAQVPFRGALTLAEVLDAEGQPRVDGCSVDPGEVTADVTVTLVVDVKLWLDQVAFERLPAPASGARAELSSVASEQRAFSRGFRKLGAWAFQIRAGR